MRVPYLAPEQFPLQTLHTHFKFNHKTLPPPVFTLFGNLQTILTLPQPRFLQPIKYQDMKSASDLYFLNLITFLHCHAIILPHSAITICKSTKWFFVSFLNNSIL